MKTQEALSRIIEQRFDDLENVAEGSALREFCRLMETGRFNTSELTRVKYQLANEEWTLDRGMLGIFNAFAHPNEKVPGTVNEALINFFQNKMGVRHEDVLTMISLLPRFIDQDQE